jgi:hypothetical protein
MRLNSVHAIIIFDEMQNGAIWGHFKVSYNIESSIILMTDRQEYLKIVKNLSFVSWQIRTLPLHQSQSRASKRNIARRNNTALGPEGRLKLLSKLWI